MVSPASDRITPPPLSVGAPACTSSVPKFCPPPSRTEYWPLKSKMAVWVGSFGGPAGVQLPDVENCPPAGLFQVNVCVCAVVATATITLIAITTRKKLVGMSAPRRPDCLAHCLRGSTQIPALSKLHNGI